MTLHAAQTAGYWALAATTALTLAALAIRRARHRAARRARIRRTLDGMTNTPAERIPAAVHAHRHGEHRR